MGSSVTVLLSSLAPAVAQTVCTEPDVVRGPARTLDTERAEAWLSTYEGPAGALDTPRQLGDPTDTIAISPDGTRIFVTGQSFGGFADQGGSHYDYATIAYDATTGQQLWQARYTHPSDSQDSPWAMEVSPDGERLYVTGISVGRVLQAGVDWDVATIAYDAATGEQVWAERYDGSAIDGGYALGLSPDGSRVFIGAESGRDFLTIAYRSEDGTKVWAERYDGGDIDYLRALSVAADGRSVFVTGRSRASNWDWATVGYDAHTGDRRWVTRYDGSGHSDDWPYAIDASPDGGSVYVTGMVNNNGQYDYGTTAYDAATGAEVWFRTYDGSAQGQMDAALGLAPSHDGLTVYVTGYSSGCRSSYDYATVAYDANTGTQRWVGRFNGLNGNNADTAYAVAVSPDDTTVYVTGETPGGLDGFVTSTSFDVGTVAYAASDGAERWWTTYDGPEHFQDGAFALVVSPDGSRVYVNGERWHNTTPGVGDFLTLAYPA